MKTLNKSLLAAAVIGAIALPGLTSAATLQFEPGKQLTYAREVLVNNGTTFYTPSGLQLTAQGSDALNVATVAAGSNVSVKVTLTNGALFDTSADAPTVVGTFLEGAQSGGNNNPLQLVGAPYYSSTGQELNFTYEATGAGDANAIGFFLQLNALQVTNLLQSVGNIGDELALEITVQNQNDQLILSQNQVIARTAWGLTIANLAQPVTETAKRIDVGSPTLRRSLFSSDGTVGSSSLNNTNDLYFNAGGFTLDIAKAQLTGSGNNTGFVSNFRATQAQPNYNIVGVATFTVTVTGSNLAAFEGGRIWLDSDQTCLNATSVPLTVVNDSTAMSMKIPATHTLFSGLTQTTPLAANVYVCLGTGTDANSLREMVPQTLSGTVAIEHNLITQRIDPDPLSFTLAALQQNGASVYFQNVNPGGNTSAESFLRLTNHNSTPCTVVLDAKDDLGRHSGEVQLTLAAHASEQLNSNVLESGNDNRFVSGGGFRNGAGKWYVRVTAECTGFTASALNRNRSTGVVTDLTPQDDTHAEAKWSTPTVQVP